MSRAVSKLKNLRNRKQKSGKNLNFLNNLQFFGELLGLNSHLKIF